MKKLDKIQLKAKNAAIKSLNKTGKALLHMATGTGKTETAIKIFSKDLKENKRILWLTHKNDLIKQTTERILDRLQANVTVFGGGHKDPSGQIVVSSVQTISKATTLTKFNQNDFDLIVVDEAHHAPAKCWTDTIEYFNADRLALTATPNRPDNKAEDVFKLFGDPAFVCRFSDAQKKKLLAPYKCKAVITNSTLEGLVSVNKDFTEKQLEKLYVSNDRNKIIIASYKEFARKEIIKVKMKPKTICFCINTKHAKRMAKLFNKSGIAAAFISSKINDQSVEERTTVFETFTKTNDIEVLCSVDILNEGSDIPDVNIGLMARPTRSLIIYTQQIGRLARLNDGKKKFFYVMDFADNTSKGWASYNIGNLTGKSYTANDIVTKYLYNDDPVEVNQMRENIMKSVEDFEDQLTLSILKSRKEKIEEALYFKKNGKHSKGFVNENKKQNTASKN